VIGCNAWEWCRQHPDVMAVFNDTMRALSALITPAVTASYDWSRFPVIPEYRELYEHAGFVLEQVVQTPSTHSLIVGRPKAD
jgi:hypothetical protein